jgi:5-methyltetrahydrofolate--homocysteine methyltransferase
MEVDEILNGLKESIVEGISTRAVDYTHKAVEIGIEIRKILDDSLIPGSEIVGEKYERMEYYLPDLVISADAMMAAMNILKPLLQKQSQKSKGILLIGTVEGDIHSIGKDLISALIEGQGYEVIDLGKDITADTFLEKARETKPDVIGLSGLITPSITKMQEIITVLRDGEITSKIIAGGGILSKESCKMIGADEFATDAWEGINKIKKLMSGA